ARGDRHAGRRPRSRRRSRGGQSVLEPTPARPGGDPRSAAARVRRRPAGLIHMAQGRGPEAQSPGKPKEENRMSEFDPSQITDAVLRSYEGAPDPRTRDVLHPLITHPHAFIREADLTLDEWSRAIDFLTRTGQMSGETRQEFILLSDVLGVSMLV